MCQCLIAKPANTFRFCDAAHRAAARTGLGSPAFGDDFAFAAKRNRFVRQHLAEHRPARVRTDFAILVLLELGGVHVANENLRIVASDLRRRHMQEMLSPVGDFRRQGAGARPSGRALKQGQISFRRRGRRRGVSILVPSLSVARLSAEVDADGAVAFAAFEVGQFDLNIDVPSAARVGRKLPRLGFPALGDRRDCQSR